MSKASDRTVAKVNAFNMDSIVERYASDQGLSVSQAREHERELKRYFSMVIDNPDYVYGMCGPIDELWHTFLVFTKPYQEFCHSVAGRFIHHFPNENAGDQNDSKTRQLKYEQFVNDYLETFGDKPPRHFWPAAMDTGEDALGCSTCNCCIAAT